MATLQEIIRYSKQNPDTDYAKRALQHIQSGAFDDQASKEGVDLSWAGRPTTAAPAPAKPGFRENVAAAFGERNKKVSEAKGRVTRGEQSTASGVFQGAGQAAGFLGDVLFEGANVLTAGKLKEGVEAAGEAIGKNEHAQKIITGISDWAKQHPEAAGNLEALLNIASIAPTGKAVQLGAKATEITAKKAAGIAGDVAEATKSAVEGFDSLTGSVKNYVSKYSPEALSAGNVDPRAQTSARRIQEAAPLSGAGAAKQRDITKTYDEFYAQEEAFKKDIKQDMAAGVVGGRIGDEFRKVVQLRRDAGKRMEEELKSVGSVQTKIGNASADFQDILAKEGLELGDEGLKSNMAQSQFAAQDIKLFDKYIAELNTLESNPTIADLDAFLKRVDSELDLYKAQNHIMGTTNGERIVKMHLHKLRQQFEPDVAGNKSLEAYRDARGAYHELSGFIKEGMTFLGKETQAGDFAKDASLAKSAVQSLLNQGKKDWLVKLEALTGYPALDEAVLAFQAMKDAGNPMGHSLLEIFTKGADTGKLPLSKSSLIERFVEFATGKAKEKYLGTPNEQTRRFLEQLKKKP